jgi:SLOG cluster2
MVESVIPSVSESPLGGLRVGIAGAVPERQYWGNVPDLDRVILNFVAQLSALVIRYGGKIVHGSQPSLTPVVAEQARLHSPQGISCLTLFASQLFGQLPEVVSRACRTAAAAVVLTRKVGDGDFRDAKTRNNSLTAMRITLTSDVDVVVAVGGKLHLEEGFNPGVFEELVQARWHGAPCFIVGAFGGAAGRFDLPIVEKLSSGNLLEGEDAPREQLATWTDGMDEYVGELLAHLVRHRDYFLQTRWTKRGLSVSSSIRAEEVVDNPFGRPTKVVTVDLQVVESLSSRFTELLQAVAQKDWSQTDRLLNEHPF